MSDNNSDELSLYMSKLATDGKYEVSDAIKAKLDDEFIGGYATDDETKATVSATFDKFGYLADTHTGVAIKVYNDYVKETGDLTETVIVSTASPYKFAADVLDAVSPNENNPTGVEAMDVLSKATDTVIPTPLRDLDKREVRFTDVCDADDMIKAVYTNLGI